MAYNWLDDLTAKVQAAPKVWDSYQQLSVERQKAQEEAAKKAQELATFEKDINAQNAKRAAALEPRLSIMKVGASWGAEPESIESYTRFLEAEKKKADFDLESFGLVDHAVAAFDPKKAERIKQVTERRNAVDARLVAVLAPGDKETDRSAFEAVSDNFKGVQATTYDIGASIGDWMSPDVTGLERKLPNGRVIPSGEFGTSKNQIMAIEAADKALELMAKGRDAAAAWAGMDDKSVGILKALTGVDSLKDITEAKLADVRNKQVQENQRRAKEGLPSIEEENAAMLGNRYAEYARSEAEKVRQDKTLESKINDARLGIATQKGMAAVAKYAWDNPTQIIEKAIESAPYLVAGGPASSTLRSLGFSAAASTTGGAIAIGALDTAQGAQQAKDAVKTTNMAELAKSSAFQELKAANPDATPAQLREVLSMAAEDRALGAGLPTNALIAIGATKLGFNPVEAAASGAAKKVTALGATGAVVREAVGEFPEEFFQQWSQNLGEIAGGVRDPSKEWENTVGAGTLGAFTGAATSGGMSAGQATIDAGATLSARSKIIKAEEQAAQTGTAQPTAQTQPDAAPTEQVRETTPAQDDQRDPADRLVPVSFFEAKLDEIIAQQDELVPDGTEQRKAFSDSAKQEYRAYLENGTPMSQGTAELVASFVPAYKEVSAPRSQEEVDAGLNQLVSDVFALSQDTDGQSLGTVNSRIMQRISGETSYQVLEKFAELQATKAANAGTTRAGQVFSAEAEAANTRAQQLKNQFQTPVVPTAQQQAPEATVTAAPEIVETPSTTNIEPPASFTDRFEEMDRLEQERAAEETPVQEVAPEQTSTVPTADSIRAGFASQGNTKRKAEEALWELSKTNPAAAFEIAKDNLNTSFGEVASVILSMVDAEMGIKEYQPAIDFIHRLALSNKNNSGWARMALTRSPRHSNLLNKPAPAETAAPETGQESDTLQSATRAGETQQVGPESTSRRKFIMGFAAAAATAAATTAAPSGTFADDVTLGEAKALTKKVLSQKVSAAVEAILRGNGGINQDGAARIKGALREIVANGPVEVRELAKKILSLMPSTGISVEVDDYSPVNAHGAVELLPYQVNARGTVEVQSSPKLTLFTLDGREGLTLKTFLHEALHVAVASRYVSLNVGAIRENDTKLGGSTPKAAKVIEEFIALFEEFRDTLTFKQKNDTSSDSISIQQAANSPDEFFVRSLTDPDFQKYLAGVEYKGNTLFDKFKDWVKTNLFGFKKGTAPSWLDAALVASNNLSDAMAKDVSDFARVDVLREKKGLQSATSATDGSVTSPKPTAKKFKDMSLFEQWAIVTQLRDTTSAAEFDSILAGIASGGIMLRNDPTTSAEASITRVGKKIVINLAQFTGKNLKQRRADAKKLRKQANATLTLKDRLSRKAKKEKLQAFYMTNFTALVQSSTSFVDALRHEVTHAKDMMSSVDMEAVNEMMANNPLWAASAAFVETNPATANMSRNDKLLETNGYYMTALSTMASNPQYAPLLATFEEAVYAPMKELTAFMTSDELLKHWASVLDSNSTTGTMQSATGRTLTLPQANRNQRLKALLEQKITSTELPKGPLKAEAAVDTSPGKSDRIKSVGLQLGMLLDARDAVEGKTKSEAVAALRALRDSEDVAEPHEANIIAGIAEDNYASRFIMGASYGLSGETKTDYTMLLSDLLSFLNSQGRDVALSSVMSLPVYTTEPTKRTLAPLWTVSHTLRSRLLGSVGGAASVAEMGEAYRSDIRVSDQENNNVSVLPQSLGGIISSIKDGMLLNSTDESNIAAVGALVAAARAKGQQSREVVINEAVRAVNKNIPKRIDKLTALIKREKANDKKKQLQLELVEANKHKTAIERVIAGNALNIDSLDAFIYAASNKRSRSLAYELKNAFILATEGRKAIAGGSSAVKSFLNSVYGTISNPEQGVELSRVFTSPEEAATNKKLVEADGKYYDLLKVVDSMIEADGLQFNRLKPPVYIRYLYDSLLAISMANNNAAVLPTYVDASGRKLHALIAEYTEVETDGGIVETEKLSLPKQVLRYNEITGKRDKDYKFSFYGYIVDSNTSDLVSDPAFMQKYKNAVEGSVIQKESAISDETTIFSLAEKYTTDIRNLDDALDLEISDLTALTNSIEEVESLLDSMDPGKDGDYAGAFKPKDIIAEDATEDEIEEGKTLTPWYAINQTIRENLSLLEMLNTDAKYYEGTDYKAFEQAISSALELSDLKSELESRLETTEKQNEIVRQMGYDFDSGNISESYDFDLAESSQYSEDVSGMPLKFKDQDQVLRYNANTNSWEKRKKSTKSKQDKAGSKKAKKPVNTLRGLPTLSDVGFNERINALNDAVSIAAESIRETGSAPFSVISDIAETARLLGKTNFKHAAKRGSGKKSVSMVLVNREFVPAQGRLPLPVSTGIDADSSLQSATGSFSGIFRNIRTRVAADDINALTAMIADRATVSAIKTGAQNNAFIGPFTRNFVNRSTHSAISTFKLRVDGLMAKSTAVIGGKVARLNREMDNLGIPQKERTELLNLLVALDETYTVQAMKAISKTALINKYKKLYGDEVQAVFDMADELRQEVDMAIDKLAKATLGQYTYDTAPKKVKDAYDALIASKQRYLHRTYHKFSISSGRLWKAQIDNAIDVIKKDGPTAVANSSSHSAKAHAAVLNAAYTVVNSWNAFTERGTPIEHAFKQVAPGWKTMNDAVKLRLVLDMFQEDFMAAAELEITNGSINSLSPASKNAGALKAKRLDGPQNKVFRELLGENRDYGRVVSETIENQTAITMHLEMMRQLQHMGLLVDKNTYDSMTVAQRELYTNVPSAGIFSAFSSSYILKDYEYAVTMPMPKVSIAKSIRDFNQAIKKGAPLEAGMAAMGGTYTAIATAFGLIKMFTVFTSPALWSSLGVGSVSFAAKSAAYPSQLADAYEIVSMWKKNQAGAPIDKNDPLYDKYMFVMGTETIDSAVWAEITTRAKDSDYEAALAQLDTNGRLVRDMGFKTVEDIKDYLIASWTKYEAIPKVAAVLAHRDNLNKFNKALGKKEVSPAYVGNIVRREFPSAKDVPELAKLSDSVGVTMFAGFYYQTIKAGSWGITQNLNEGLQMYREAGSNSTAKAESGKFIARILAGSAMQWVTIAGLTYLLKALFTMDDDDMDEEQRKLKKAAEATLYLSEDPDNLMHIGFHEDGTPLFVDVTMMVNPLDVRDSLFRRAFDSMSSENKETLSDVLFDHIPYGFVGQSVRNYMRGMEPDKNATKAYDRLSNAGIFRYINNLNEYGVAPGEAGPIAGALANISGIKKIDPSDRLAQMGYQVFFANEDLAERVKDVIYDGDSYNKPQMRDQIEDELDYVGMKARVYFDATNDAFKRSGMTRSEFISAMTKSLPETKAKMFAKDLSKALVDEGENYDEERAAYSAKQIVSYYNKEVKKGLLSAEKGGPLFNASSYEVASATRNKTSYEAIIDAPKPSAPIKATVTGVYDADTLYVTTDSGRQLKVRIQNIDAFELKQKLKDGSLNIGKEGQQYLSSLVNNKQVTLFGYGYDDNGRMIARVLTKDGRDAGTVVAEEGYAIMTDISELESYPTKAEDMDAVAPSVYRERNK